ncbi:MAG TPA: hypothetical protein VHC44_16545 [Verrucomicrobiae bacterium]|nr:hypothetical protein [Verrucomicrobiae bacterium]
MSGLKLLFLAIRDEFKTLIGGGLWNQNKHAPKNQNQSEGEKQNVPEQGIAVPNCPASMDPCQPTNKKRTKAEKIDLARFCLEVITLCIACGLAVVYYIQMNASLEQMKANRRQAIAAEQQLKDIRDAQRLDERAWVVASDYEPVPSGDLVYFKVFLKNSGKTPAVNCFGIGYSTNDITNIPENDIKPTKEPNAGLLAPGATEAISIGMFPKQQIWDVKTNGGTLYLAGTIWYDDIFGSNHWSQFCVQVIGSPSREALLQCRPTTIHNSCDDVERNKAK